MLFKSAPIFWPVGVLVLTTVHYSCVQCFTPANDNVVKNELGGSVKNEDETLARTLKKDDDSAIVDVIVDYDYGGGHVVPKREKETRNESDNGVSVEKSEKEKCGSSMDEFPADLFTQEQRNQGAVVLHAFFGFYCFLVTAYACNDYLLPALDLICTDMKISPNVAGATFLATASCFPELFVSVVGTFLTTSDLGVGTVVGGAVFNTFATPAFGALSAAQSIPLEWTVLSRDCIIYVISVFVLVLVMWDGLVTWYEATILMILFAAYFTLLFMNDSLLRLIRRIKAKFLKKNHLSTDRGERSSETHESMPTGSFKPFVHGELVVEYRNSIIRASKLKTMENGNERKGIIVNDELEEYVEPDYPFRIGGRSKWRKAWSVFTWPIRVLLFFTIPDCRYKKLRNWYSLTFVMCVMWIAVSSYLVSWMMTVVGDTLGIADSIMGITFLSAGGNMPELVSIVILSRQGNGDMAMSNTLGANTLDVLLCLGLPWMIRTLMTGKNVEIESGAIAYSVISIIICVIGFFSVTAYYKFTLNKKVGALCLIMYILFLTIAILMESNVFFELNSPKCN